MTENDEYLLTRLFDCVQRVSKTIPGFCPLIFDSWSCFNSTPAGTVQKEPCPDFEIFNFSPSRFASKECDETGSWLVHPWSNKTWTSYTNCVDHKGLKFHTRINIISLTGLSLSLFCLVISLFVFNAFRSLSCGRVAMHKNLFLSLILSNISWLLCWLLTTLR